MIVDNVPKRRTTYKPITWAYIFYKPRTHTKRRFEMDEETDIRTKEDLEEALARLKEAIVTLSENHRKQIRNATIATVGVGLFGYTVGFISGYYSGQQGGSE